MSVRHRASIPALVGATALLLGACTAPGSQLWIASSWDVEGTVDVPFIQSVQTVGAATGGGIVIGGGQRTGDPWLSPAAVRVDPTGRVVYAETLGSNGEVNGTVSSLAGDLFVGSTRDPGVQTRGALWRFDASGHHDPAFGTGGAVVLDAPAPVLPPDPYIQDPAPSPVTSVIAVEVDGSGRIYAAVSAVRGLNWIHQIRELFVVRLLADGTPDPTWGIAGWVDIGSHILTNSSPTPKGTLTFVDDDHLVLSAPHWAGVKVGSLDVTAPGPVALTAIGNAQVTNCPGGNGQGTVTGATAVGGNALISLGSGSACDLPTVLAVGATGSLDPTFGSNGVLTWPAQYGDGTVMSAIGTVFATGDHLAVASETWSKPASYASGRVEFGYDGTLTNPELWNGMRPVDLGVPGLRHNLSDSGSLAPGRSIGSASSDAVYLAGATLDDPANYASIHVRVTKLKVPLGS